MVRTSRRRDAVAALARRAREGLSLAAVSAETGIPVGTLSWWSWRLRQEGARATEFVEVSVDDAGGIAEAQARDDLTVVTAGGTRIVLPVTVDVELLRKVLDAVERRC